METLGEQEGQIRRLKTSVTFKDSRRGPAPVKGFSSRLYNQCSQLQLCGLAERFDLLKMGVFCIKKSVIPKKKKKKPKTKTALFL